MSHFSTPFRFLSPAFMTAALLLASFSTTLAGGPWLLPKKAGFAQVMATPAAYPYTRLLNGTFRETAGINRSVYTVDFGFYGEYGITDKVNVMASIPLKLASVGNQTDSLYNPTLLENGSIFGLSNTAVGLKFRLLDTDHKLAVSLQSSLNTVSTDLDKGLATGWAANAFGVKLHYGAGFNANWYAFVEAGYLKYTNNFSDIIDGTVEVGRKVGDKFTLMLTTLVRLSLRNGSYLNENLVQTGLSPNDQEWVATNFKINYEAESDWGVNFGLPVVPIYFKNVGFTGAFSLAVYKKW